MRMDEIDLKEWKNQWNNGDVKFVPELFEMVEDLLSANELLQKHILMNGESHRRVMKQLEAQNKALVDQITKMDLARPRQLVIPEINFSEEAVKWIKKGINDNCTSQTD